MAILSWLTFILWIALWAYWFISAFRVKKSVHMTSWRVRQFGFHFGIRLVILVFVLYAIKAGHGGMFAHLLTNQSIPFLPVNILVSAIGAILCFAGIAFAVWARVYLGRNWGMPMSLREKPELVTSGPYQFVRHPIYGGFLVAMFGTGLVDGSIWFLILIFMGAYFIYSAKIEEKIMLKEFPDQYPEYKKRTKMLIPFIV